MVTTASRTFVYGRFVVGRAGIAKSKPGSSQHPELAIELLREFSSSEFIGKLYGRAAGTWSPFTPYGIGDYAWYRAFLEGDQLFFDMQGGKLWEVLEFRTESDETGSYYIAVALKHLEAPRGRFGASRSIANTSNEMLDSRATAGKKT